MSNIIKLKHGNSIPIPENLENYELGYAQKGLYIKDNDQIICLNSNPVRYYTETNPLLDTSSSVGPMYTFSWNIPVTTSGVTHRPIVQVYDAASTDEELVLTDVMINSDYDVTIKITIEATSISAGSYRAIVIG